MKRMNIFLVVFLLISFTSCKSRRTIEFREAIVQKERVAFNIVLGKNGSEVQKLERLIKNDYKGALALVDKQAREFDQLIKDIESLPADGIRQGEALKRAAVDYYAALKELHFFDRREIAQSEAIHQLGDEELSVAQHELVALAHEKKIFYEKVYRQEEMFATVLKKFDAANDI